MGSDSSPPVLRFLQSSSSITDDGNDRLGAVGSLIGWLVGWRGVYTLVVRGWGMATGAIQMEALVSKNGWRGTVSTPLTPKQRNERLGLEYT
jgi:hypothetical protein